MDEVTVKSIRSRHYSQCSGRHHCRSLLSSFFLFLPHTNTHSLPLYLGPQSRITLCVPDVRVKLVAWCVSRIPFLNLESRSANHLTKSNIRKLCTKILTRRPVSTFGSKIILDPSMMPFSFSDVPSCNSLRMKKEKKKKTN